MIAFVFRNVKAILLIATFITVYYFRPAANAVASGVKEIIVNTVRMEQLQANDKVQDSRLLRSEMMYAEMTGKLTVMEGYLKRMEERDYNKMKEERQLRLLKTKESL